jgi:hypothetical protein
MTLFFATALSKALCVIFLLIGQRTAKHLGNVSGGLAACRHFRYGYPTNIADWYSLVRKQTRNSAKALLVWIPALMVSALLLAFSQQLVPGLLWGKGWTAFFMLLVCAFYALQAALNALLTLKLSHGAAIRDREVCMAASRSILALTVSCFLTVI